MRPIVALALLLSAVCATAERIDLSDRRTLEAYQYYVLPLTLRSTSLTLEYFMLTFDAASSTACGDLTIDFKVDGTKVATSVPVRTPTKWTVDTDIPAYSKIELVLNNKTPGSCTVDSIYAEFAAIATPAPPRTPAPPAPTTRRWVSPRYDTVEVGFAPKKDDSPNVVMLVGLIGGGVVLVIIIVIVVVCVCVKRRKTGKTNEDVPVTEELMPTTDYHNPQQTTEVMLAA